MLSEHLVFFCKGYESSRPDALRFLCWFIVSVIACSSTTRVECPSRTQCPLQSPNIFPRRFVQGFYTCMLHPVCYPLRWTVPRRAVSTRAVQMPTWNHRRLLKPRPSSACRWRYQRHCVREQRHANQIPSPADRAASRNMACVRIVHIAWCGTERRGGVFSLFSAVRSVVGNALSRTASGSLYTLYPLAMAPVICPLPPPEW